MAADAERIGSLRREHMIYRVQNVAFFCINRATWDHSTAFAGAVSDDTVHAPEAVEHPCYAVRKYLMSGTFYFSYARDFDITARVQRANPNASISSSSHGSKVAEEVRHASRFAWNTSMIEPMIEYRARLEPERRAIFDEEELLVRMPWHNS